MNAMNTENMENVLKGAVARVRMTWTEVGVARQRRDALQEEWQRRTGEGGDLLVFPATDAAETVAMKMKADHDLQDMVTLEARHFSKAEREGLDASASLGGMLTVLVALFAAPESF